MSFVRKYILWVLLVGSLGYAYYFHEAHRPCITPIAYSLGTFDTQFGLSREDFLARVKDASEVWSKALGKELFVYDPKGKLVVNLIYDKRQEMVNQNEVLKSSAESIKDSAAAIKTEYTELQKEYEAKLQEYNKHKTESTRIEINRLADEINSRIKDYNVLVGEINSKVNIINKSAGLEFDEGEYISDSKGERIDIYEFTGKLDLKRVLAHELGHALGLGHVENQDSIMYYLNKSKNDKATAEDKAELREVCNVK